MNQKTKDALQQINENIPKHLVDDLTVHIVDKTQEDAVKKLLLDTTMPDATRKKLEKDVADGVFVQEFDKVDDEVTAQIDEYFAEAIKKGLEDGTIDPPEADDPFVKRLEEISKKELEKKGEAATHIEAIVLNKEQPKCE